MFLSKCLINKTKKIAYPIHLPQFPNTKTLTILPSPPHPAATTTTSSRALFKFRFRWTQADKLKFVAGQFRRLHSRQVQHTFQFYSQQWRTWAACFIQAAWRRYSKRKTLEQRRKEEEEAELAAGKNGGNDVSSSGSS
ncbi:putative IQ motif, EF-hand binding protein [Helianthus anomalus]